MHPRSGSWTARGRKLRDISNTHAEGFIGTPHVFIRRGRKEETLVLLDQLEAVAGEGAYTVVFDTEGCPKGCRPVGIGYLYGRRAIVAEALILLQSDWGFVADSDLVPIGRLSQGATGVDVERWVRGARRRARKEKPTMLVEDLRAETGAVLPDYILKNREITAVHEIGHAILYELAWPGGVEEVRLLDRPVDGAWG